MVALVLALAMTVASNIGPSLPTSEPLVPSPYTHPVDVINHPPALPGKGVVHGTHP